MTVTVNNGALSAREQAAYVEYVQSKHPTRTLEALTITVDGEFVDLDYRFAPQSFERIRRITGYLVGTMDRWNDAKRAEEGDRVRHTI